jgi:hypothetical protein
VVPVDFFFARTEQDADPILETTVPVTFIKAPNGIPYADADFYRLNHIDQPFFSEDPLEDPFFFLVVKGNCSNQEVSVTMENNKLTTQTNETTNEAFLPASSFEASWSCNDAMTSTSTGYYALRRSIVLT